MGTVITQAQPLCIAEAKATLGGVEEILTATRARIAEEEAAYAQPFTDVDLMEAVKSNELGDARLFIRLNAGKLSYDHASRQWYEFSGHFWKLDETDNTLARLDEIVDLYAGLARRIYSQIVQATKTGDKESAQTLKEFESMIRKKIGLLQRRRHRENVLVLGAAGASSLGITGREWDSNPYLLPFLNGVLDLKTRTFRPGRPDDFVKTVCPIEWKGFDVPAPRWEKFLLEILNGDIETIAYLKRLLGYEIAGLSVEHILPIFWGPEGRNGKGTLLEILGHVLGPIAGPIPGELMLEQKNPRSSAAPSPDLMALRGKRLTWVSETDEGRALSAGRVKWLCGGDTITARPPFGKRQVVFPPTHTLMLLTNFRPRVNPGDAALWDRLHLVEFKISFVDAPARPNQRPRDKYLSIKLKQEASGIIAWLVAGNFEWQEKGLAPPFQILGSTKEYRKSEDSVAQFIEQCCVVGDGKIARAKELADAYVDFCEDGGLKAIGKKKFFEKLHGNFLKDRDNKGIYYNGLGLKTIA